MGLEPGHLNDAIRDTEIITRPSHYENGRDTVFLVELSHSVDKRRYWLMFLGNQLLHALITDHEVRCAGVFIYQDDPGSNFHHLTDERSLGGGSAGVQSREGGGYILKRDILDKGGDVGLDYAPATCGAHFHRLR